MSADEAKQYGLISEVYNHDDLDKVWDYLKQISELSSEVLLFFNVTFSLVIHLHCQVVVIKLIDLF